MLQKNEINFNLSECNDDSRLFIRDKRLKMKREAPLSWYTPRMLAS